MVQWVRVDPPSLVSLSFIPRGGNRDLTPISCPLTSIYVLWHMNTGTHIYILCIHTKIHIYVCRCKLKIKEKERSELDILPGYHLVMPML